VIRPRALLIDAFGTLLELREPPARTYTRIAADFGIRRQLSAVQDALDRVPVPAPEVPTTPRSELPARERAAWREFVRAALGDEAADGPCFAALWTHYSGTEAWRLAPGAAEALRRVRAAGICVGVLSNMDARLLRILDRLGVRTQMDGIFLPSTTGLAKPDPRAFHRAARTLGADPSQALYIGDREPDCVSAAHAAGLRTLRYDPSADPAPDVLRAWSELPEQLDQA